MRFSVATPTRNSLPKLKACVGSIRGQLGVEWEHLVQDAASTDGTPQWLSSQANLSWASEPDDGMYDAIERAWSRATGDVFSWLNSDEQYLPGTMTLVESAFNANPDADFVYGHAIIVDPFDLQAGAPLGYTAEAQRSDASAMIESPGGSGTRPTR